LRFTFDMWQNTENGNKKWRNAYINAAVSTFFFGIDLVVVKFYNGSWL